MKLAASLLLACSLIGCSSVQATAIATGPVHAAPRGGPVAIYAAQVPVGSIELGQVEVQGEGTDGAVETLLPVFVQKVAALGGDQAVIDSIDAKFELQTTTMPETVLAQCAWRTCIGTRYVPTTAEVLTVKIRGRAMRAPAAVSPEVGP